MERTAICTLVKDEQKWIREWAVYHHALGVQDIHVVEDFGSGSHAGALAGLDYCTVHPVEDFSDIGQGTFRQTETFKYFINDYAEAYDWCLCIDVDEFLTFADGWDLERLTRRFRHAGSVLLKWMTMNADGRVYSPDGGAIGSFNEVTEASLEYSALQTVKPLINVRRFNSFYTVHATNDAVSVNGTTNLLDCDFSKAWLRHYQTKSWEDWVNKLMVRGDLYNGHYALEDFFILNPGMADRREELMALVPSLVNKK